MARTHPHSTETLAPPSFDEVAPGIYSYVQPDGTWFINNCGFIDAGGQVVVIDTTSTEARTQALLAAIRDVTDNPVTRVVNTHHHGDHTNGNYLFEGATIVAHRECRRVMTAVGISDYSAVFPGVEWGALEFCPPTLTFDGGLDLWAGDLQIQLHDLGYVAHTEGDVMAWIPDHGVLFAGDLVFHGGTPFSLFGSVRGTIDAMDRLEAFGAQVMVPGHGPAAHGAKAIGAALDDQREYLKFVQAGAADGISAGRSPLEQAQASDLGRFAAWTDAERLVGNLHVAYREADHNPNFAIDTAIGEMIIYNGGQLPRCLA